MPTIRSTPEDFRVEEIPLYPLLGEGPHTYLLIEKRERTTDAVLRDLARQLAVERRDVGYAGRKDRHAVTRQWFSVPVLDPEQALALELPGARVLEAHRHPHKLRVGQLSGNRFEIVVRDVDEAQGEHARQALKRLEESGLPNRFGPQRFGFEGKNVERGVEVLRAKRLRGDRRHATLMVSALQSEVFNRLLARRDVGRLLPGDIAVVHASGGLFQIDDPAGEEERLRSFVISPTGPIFGTKMKRPAGAVGELEQQVLDELGIGDLRTLRPPRGLRLFGSRRALRIKPENLAATWHGSVLELGFELPAGSYATVLLEELFPDGLVDVSGQVAAVEQRNT